MSNPIVDTEELEKFKPCNAIDEIELEFRRSFSSGSVLLQNVTSCSTAVAYGLSQQIIDEINLIIPNLGRETRDIRSLAVLAFQKLWNKNNIRDPIVEDSLYGPQVEARLNQSPIEGFGLTLMSNQVRTLKLTNPLMQGLDVRLLQEALVRDGFAIAVDGFYGEETEAAVRQFQARTGLVIDGIFGLATHHKLFG